MNRSCDRWVGIGALAVRRLLRSAREVVLGTLGVIYNLGNVDLEEEEGQTQLQTQSRNATWDGSSRMVFTVPMALGLMVFFALCAQCAATLVIIKRETNSWRWPVFTFTYMTVLAYFVRC